MKAATLTKIVASNIRRHLQELDRRPAWLAKKSGVTKSQISRLIGETSCPNLATVVAIAEALDVEVTELLKKPSVSMAEVSS